MIPRCSRKECDKNWEPIEDDCPRRLRCTSFSAPCETCEKYNPIKSKSSKTWKAQIYVGLRKGYSDEILTIDRVYRTVQKYVDEIGWRVSVTPTKFIYKQGHEPGVIIEAIQYPRFPTPEEVLKTQVIQLAKILLEKMEQNRLTICFPEDTIMLEDKYEV